jgi:hypothetical protein
MELLSVLKNTVSILGKQNNRHIQIHEIDLRKIKDSEIYVLDCQHSDCRHNNHVCDMSSFKLVPINTDILHAGTLYVPSREFILNISILKGRNMELRTYNAVAPNINNKRFNQLMRVKTPIKQRRLRSDN